jgi:hypothetical protein
VGRGASGVTTNTAVGVSALAAATNGTNNTAVGYEAQLNLSSGTHNTFVGWRSGANLTSGISNVFLGANAGSSNNGSANTFIGRDAGAGLTGTTSNNTFIGNDAGGGITTGANNVCVGRFGGRYLANGSSALTTPTNSVYVGPDSRGTNSDSNSIVIGYQAIGEGANTVVIGNSSTVQQHFYATRYIKTEGSLVFASSTPTAIVANQNDYVLTGSAFQRLNCTTASDITGIAPPTGGSHVDGRMIRLVSVGTATVRLMHNDTGSTAANRMFHHNSTNVSLTVNEWADLVYDSTDNGSGAAGWRVVNYA